MTADRGRRLYLDGDGVLFDFESVAESIFGVSTMEAEATLGSDMFWETLQWEGGFYEHLPLMPDALQLFNHVKHLNPTILTGCPPGGWAEPQKVACSAKYFPGTPIITCKASEKYTHCLPGDILVDDRPKYRRLWEKAGGIFVVHTSANSSLRELRRLGFDTSCHDYLGSIRP